ncbi:L-ornithine N5-oxygenase [Kitasatospora sp. MAP12-15]|uniref:SidA/IucD/PvdA family monooxygenase n=1 Tax=unclassified Kitasatospora TaxID=2633591 RepID=UPI002475EE17|nr:SidA/IucD/PvdA family monooxygenase [Kitasatospora sp. MAP12-44]MDH6114566.1 L-ornithine N5-oxygenase [Kitasatospora sp. MAP12-44]
MTNSQIHDLIGVGFGPANISLAVALEELHPEISPLFLEARDTVVWQPEMLLSGSDIQNNPVRDLVTPRNPRSRYTFLNFLFEQGRLLEYLNLGLEFPLRKEYNQYITWVGSHFADRVRTSSPVAGVEFAALPDGTEGYQVRVATGETHLARAVVVAHGRTPFVPAPFDQLESDRVIHLTRYKSTVERLAPQLRTGRVAVIGGSQSAVELTLDLAHRFPDAEVVNLTRGFAHRLKDTSPFSEASIMPEFVDYYFHASQQSKDELDADLRFTNYSAADMDVLRELHLMMYEQKLDGAQKVHVRNNSVVTEAAVAGEGVELTVQERHYGQAEKEHFDLVVLATGFRNLGAGPTQEPHPPVLAGIAEELAHTERGAVAVGYDYLVSASDGRALPPLFLYNLNESSHGIADAGSFSLLSLRAEAVARTAAKLLTRSDATDGDSSDLDGSL